MRRMLYVAAFLLLPPVILAAVSGSGSSLAATRPGEVRQEPQEVPVYDEAADAAVVIEAALEVARRENKRVLVQWGGNWCGWCKLLHQMFQDDREIARKLLYEYEVVTVDIGRWDKNLDLVARFRADIQGSGVPYLTVLDPDGSVVVNQETGSLEKKDAPTAQHDREKVLAFLDDWRPAPRDADMRLEAARAEAARTGRAVLLHFGAPWCGWCRRLETWLRRPRVEMIWSKVFVDLKVDVDRDTGGQALERRYTRGKLSGIPFFVVLDSDGRVAADSFLMPDGGNIGCPWSEEELVLFEAFLERRVPAFSEAERTALIAEMKAQQEEEAAAAPTRR